MEEEIKNSFLRKWLKDSSIIDFDMKKIIDWDYYIERFASTVQKIVIIPSIL